MRLLRDTGRKVEGQLVVSAPSGGRNEYAVVNAVSGVRDLIHSLGISGHAVSMEPYYVGSNSSSPIKVSFTTFVANGPECGRWPNGLENDRKNLSYGNFGCAQQKNLAAMVDNPKDLVRPRGFDPRDPARRDQQYDKWVAGEVSAAEKSQDERAGTISGGGELIMSNLGYTSEFDEDRVEPVLQSDIIDTSHPQEMEPEFHQAQDFAQGANDVPVMTSAPVTETHDDFEANPERARPIPRISIQAFCEDQRTAEVVQSAAADRRLAKAHVGVHLGGTQAALANFQDAPTPNLIIIESMQARDGMLAELEQLASVCDAGTKVVVVGHVNDVILYRELLRRGVSEYLVGPISELKIMESISNLYNDPDADPVGHIFAFVGAKGGVGSSTICHNVAWNLSRDLSNDVVIADMDLPFGTAGLDFDKDPVQGIADALSSPDRLDEVLLDRLLAKCTDHLSLFASPSTLDRDYDIAPEAYEWVIDVVRQNVPYVAIDLPHLWAPWTRQILTQADEIVITVAPDLANLRNAKNLVDLLRDRRSNDNPPHLVINQTGMPKRPEIPASKFAEALGLTPSCIIEFDGESFGMASNNGQMLGEFAEASKAAGTDA